MFSSAKFLIIIICIAEAKNFYNPDEPPLVRVNGMSLQAKPVHLSEVDYVAEYKYMEGDEVDVRCYTFGTIRESIRIEYAVADTFSALVSINIDGVAIRPQKKKRRMEVNTYLVEYQPQTQYDFNQVNVVCGVDQEDLQLVVTDTFNLTRTVKTELIPSKQAKMSFIPEFMYQSYQLTCSAHNITSGTAEEVIIIADDYSSLNYFIVLDLFPLNATVMRFYSIYDLYYKFVYYFYEFEAGEILHLNCTLRQYRWVRLDLDWYLQSDDSETCEYDECTLSKQLNLTREDNNTKYSFYGIKKNRGTGDTNFSIVAEVRVIFRMINNKTKSWQSFYQNSKGKTAVSPPSEATNPDHTTTIIVSVVSTVGGALVLCGLAYLIVRLRRRSYERRLRFRIAANTAPQFYLNLILREDCDRQIAEIDQHIYEEIGPPIYDVIDNRDYEEIDEPDYAEIDMPAFAESNGAVCEESVAPVSEEIHAPVYENIDAPVHGEINTAVHGEINIPVHEKIDAPVHVDFETSVYEPMHQSVKWPMEMDKIYTERKIKKRADNEDDADTAETKI